ncbi:hypothetical protein PR048_011243 [Dryococelus australis]|uniref:DUF659 domain-containing protein n=1 Tax=Dryococelus australis TaxID=614101 RepID=A0ABQ9HL29_9NEOP|nr:hypothetical protein PR048_011243 [Dryococelus australis]
MTHPSSIYPRWAEVKKASTGKSVCMALDGWSNVHNDTTVCVPVSDVLDGCINLTETIDNEDNSHTSDYLSVVRSFVTNTAANIGEMRDELAEKDVEDYFKNTHFAAAKYKQAGRTALALPTDVRWNSLADCLESYLDNWHITAKIWCENQSVIQQHRLSEEQHSAEAYQPDAMPDLITYKAKCSPSTEYLLSPATLNKIKPLVWWLALEKTTHHVTLTRKNSYTHCSGFISWD